MEGGQPQGRRGDYSHTDNPEGDYSHTDHPEGDNSCAEFEVGRLANSKLQDHGPKEEVPYDLHAPARFAMEGISKHQFGGSRLGRVGEGERSHHAGEGALR
jgi:hypothetical protein